MGLTIGPENTTSGMSRAIYDEIDRLLAPPLQQAVNAAPANTKADAEKALDGAREGWKKLAYAVAKGVVDHIVANLEVYGVTTRGNVGVAGNSGSGGVDNHQHPINLAANNVVFVQNNDGTGRVR